MNWATPPMAPGGEHTCDVGNVMTSEYTTYLHNVNVQVLARVFDAVRRQALWGLEREQYGTTVVDADIDRDVEEMGASRMPQS